MHHAVLYNTNGQYTRKNREKYALKEKALSFPVLWYRNSVGIPTGFFLGLWIGMGIEIQSQWQPWKTSSEKCRASVHTTP